MIINKKTFDEQTTFFGCSKDCNNLKLAVKIEFDCSHPVQALGFLRNMIGEIEDYEIIFNSEDEKCHVLIYPEQIQMK